MFAFQFKHAHVVKLVDTHVSGTCAARYGGSSPSMGTKSDNLYRLSLFYFASV